MVNMTIKEMINAVNGQCEDQKETLLIASISTDSRTIKPGGLYIALIGKTFDGHQFVNDAVLKGAAAIMVSKPVETHTNIPVIKVEDTTRALGDLAAYYRNKLSIPVIGVTGSVGKTSTKDMIATALSSCYQIHKSMGNYNNHIGLPLSVLSTSTEHDVMVLEMGMSALGEIEYLSQIARPSIAVITNIGLSHIETLKTQENILKAKLEITKGLEQDGVLILNADDPLLKGIKVPVTSRVIYVGTKAEADYCAFDIKDRGDKGSRFKVNIDGSVYNVELGVFGLHHITNALVAITCAVQLGIAPARFISQLKNYRCGEKRLEIIERDGIRFIDDSYNASPDSFRAGLKVLKSLAKGKRAIAIIGNMLELGETAPFAHHQVGQMCAELEVDFVAIMGQNAADVAEGLCGRSNYKIFNTHEEIVCFMRNYLKPDDTVLIKGSRGMGMDNVLKLW